MKSFSITKSVPLFALLCLIVSFQFVSAAPLMQSTHTLTYTIDRSNVPALSFNDLTLIVNVGTISSAQVTAGGTVIPHTYDPATGKLRFTTATTSVQIVLYNVANPQGIGAVTKATLKDDKKWAWSIGFDDNSGLESTIDTLNSYGYRGTIFQIGEKISETRNESWIIDRLDMIAYLNQGWSFGSHTWDHNCYQSGDRSATIINGYNRIAEIVSQSSRPDYKVIAFASPCFDSGYHSYILNMRNSGTIPVQFDESGSDYPLVVDAGQTSDFSINDKSVYAFNFDRAIGRDFRIEYDVQGAISEVDWIAAQASPTRHFWYNTLAHGDNQPEVQQVVSHIYNNYGAGGSNEIWVAPSDQIYSYLLTRERSTVTLASTTTGGATNTPTSAPTPTETNTPLPTNTPTQTNTPVPTSTPTQANTPTQTNTPLIINTPTNTPSALPVTNPAIQVANQSGVAGYEIGIFGTGFGTARGNGFVTILGAQAQISEWSDGFIRVTVPNVATGTGSLIVASDSLNQATAPFTVYTINPLFQNQPEVKFQNLLQGRQAYVSGLSSYNCYSQPQNIDLAPASFLTDFSCGYQEIVGPGNATFAATANIAVEITEGLSGNYYFQFFTESSWYDFYSVPKDYQIQVSSNSTNGSGGSWTTLQTITGNNRASRLHQITVPAGNYRWLRMQVTASQGSGNSFNLKEIRLYKPTTDSGNSSDAFALYGDSLTANAFEAIGKDGLAAEVKTLRGTADDLLFSVYGLSGQNTAGLIDQSGNSFDIYDAFALDDMINRSTYWGIGLGTNDSNDGSGAIGVSGTNIEEYENRLGAIVQYLIGRNRVPLVARIPDTIESWGGYGDLATKKKILADIDAISAQYRLVPGPDLYTTFRRNIETNSGSYYGNDGTHHSDVGEIKLIDLWAAAFVAGTRSGPTVTPPTNDSPVINNPGNQISTVGDSINVQVTATDPDGDPMTFTASGLPAGLTMNGSGLVAGTVTTVGTYSVQVTVTDGRSGQATGDFTWAVVSTINNAPTVTNPGNQSSTVGSSVSLSINATDPDGDTLTYSTTGLPVGLSINGNSGVISGAPTTAGTFAVLLSASDGVNGVTVNFTWTISQTPSQPTIRTIYDEGVATGWSQGTWSSVTVNLNNSSPVATGSKSVSATYGPAWSTLFFRPDNPLDSSGYESLRFKIYGTANNHEIQASILNSSFQTSREYRMTLTANQWTDVTIPMADFGDFGDIYYVMFQNPKAQNQLTIYLDDIGLAYADGTTPPNSAPIIDNPGSLSSTVNDTVNLPLSASDPDGDSLLFTAIGLPPGMSIDSNTGTISGIPSAAGNYSITVTASDGTANTSISFAWEIGATGTVGGNAFAVYDDALASNWIIGSWAPVTINVNSSSPVYAGSNSLAMTHASAWSTLYVRAGNPLNQGSYRALRFFVYGTAANQTFNVSIMDSAFQTSSPVTVNPPVGQWTKVEIPMADFGSFGDIYYLLFRNPKAQSQPVIYLDNVELMESNTVRRGPVSTFDLTTVTFGENGLPLGLSFDSQSGQVILAGDTATPLKVYLPLGSFGAQP